MKISELVSILISSWWKYGDVEVGVFVEDKRFSTSLLNGEVELVRCDKYNDVIEPCPFSLIDDSIGEKAVLVLKEV
jgi:hypothetical protein